VAFDLDEALAVLERTPGVLQAQLKGLPEAWTEATRGEGTWSAREIVGHLIHGEDTDWVPRLRQILAVGKDAPFEPFDRFAQESRFKDMAMADLLSLFARRRTENLLAVRALDLGEAHWELRGLHPAFGEVTLAQLLATWVVHDLGHLAQVQRTLAHRYREDVGPWVAYLPVLTR